MQFFADGALEKAGAAEDAEQENAIADVVEESIYMLELPTISEDLSLAAAIDLGLRSDPAVEKKESTATSYLKSLGGEDNDKLDGACVSTCAKQKAIDVFPPLTWFPKLTKAGIKSDVIAALTVGVMAVPQSMSYASIAGLDFVYGLYAAAVPALIYGFLGGSGQLAVGPVALVSLIVEEGLRHSLTKNECPEFFDDDDPRRFLVADTLANECPDEYARLVHVCMFFVGVLQVGGSIAQLGFLVNFLGHPVVSGFTSGAAIVIGMSQIKSWLGVSVPKSQFAYETLGDLIGKVVRGEAKAMPFFLGLVSYALLWGIRKSSQKYPKRFGWLRPMGPLLVCVASLILMICAPTLRDDYGVEVIGLIPSGLPPMTVSVVFNRFTKDASRVLPTAMSAALVGLLESIAIGKSLAAKHGDDLPSTREMRAVGSANLIGALFSGYPVAGSFSRSAVANSTGASSPLAGLVTSLFLFLTLIALPKFARKLPRFVLASIVISSVVNLVAIDEAKKLWKIRKQDFALWMLAFLGVLFIGVLFGLAVAVAVSLCIVIYEAVRPQMCVLWKLPGTMVYRNVKQGETNGLFVDGVLVVRVGASMYFFNVAYIKDTVLDLARKYDKTIHKQRAASGDEDEDDRDQLFDLGAVHYVVIEMTPVQSIDTTAIHMLEDLSKDLKRRGVHMCLASCGSRVEETFRRAGVQSHIGYEWFHSNVNSAVEFCVRHKAAVDALRDSSRLLGAYKDVGADLQSDQQESTDVVDEGLNDDEMNHSSSHDDIELAAATGHSLVRRGSGGSRSDSGSNESTPGKPTAGGGVLPSFFKGGGTTSAPKKSDDNPSTAGQSKKDPRVLLLASKHRIINRDVDPYAQESVLLKPERQALDALVDTGHDEHKQPEYQPLERQRSSSPSTPEEVEKRRFFASRRAVVKRSASSNEIASLPMHEKLAPPRVVAFPDESAPDLMMFVAIDVADRPGVLRDVSDCLSRSLALQVRFTEAAVVSQRSVSIWRCEVVKRGGDEVVEAARRVESVVLSRLTQSPP